MWNMKNNVEHKQYKIKRCAQKGVHNHREKGEPEKRGGTRIHPKRYMHRKGVNRHKKVCTENIAAKKGVHRKGKGAN